MGQCRDARALRGEDLSPRLFHEPCAFNLFSHDSDVGLDTGVNGEEQKIIDETRKIWDAPSLRVSPTFCICSSMTTWLPSGDSS